MRPAWSICKGRALSAEVTQRPGLGTILGTAWHVFSVVVAYKPRTLTVCTRYDSNLGTAHRWRAAGSTSARRRPAPLLPEPPIRSFRHRGLLVSCAPFYPCPGHPQADDVRHCILLARLNGPKRPHKLLITCFFHMPDEPRTKGQGGVSWAVRPRGSNGLSDPTSSTCLSPRRQTLVA